MAFDGLFTRAITHEIANSLYTGRISKIYQPSKYEILLHIRANGKNQKLILSAHPTYARLHLTNQNYDSPALPPMFCMLLRKHLEGGFIEKIEQIDLERIIQITVRSRNEIGDESLKTLVIEIMGRHSNIILVDTKTNNILDSLKHVSLAVNRHRTVYAGAEYIAPPAQHKINPLQIETDDEFIRPLDFLSGNMDKQLVGTFTGISPLFAKEVVKKAGMANEKALSEAFFSIQKPLLTHTYAPTMSTVNGKEFFYLFPLTHLQGEEKTFSSVSELLDRFFFGKAERDRVKQQAHDLERFMQNEKNKNEKKLIKLEKTLQDAGKADKYQLFGELLTTNMYALKKGDKDIEVVNYYDENGGTVKITLDPLKTPSDNAQRYFQKYQKAKNSVVVVEEQIEKTNEEILYFDSLLQQMEAASSKDIEEIREELAEEGYMRNRKAKMLRRNQLNRYWTNI